MQKNIFFSYGFDITLQERIDHIKKTGFDGVFVSLEAEDYLTDDEIQKIMDCSLQIETLHLPAKGYINSIWEENPIGDLFINQLKEDIQKAASFHIKRVILHLNSKKIHPDPSLIGLQRIQSLLQVCQKFDILLCIENNRDMKHLFYVFEKIHNDHLRFCLDTGHANAFTHNLMEFPTYPFVKEKLECLHLHDNDGKNDQHRLPFQGNIDWKKLMPLLLKINPQLNLTLEIHPYGIIKTYADDLEFLKDAFDRLCLLEMYCKK